MTKKHQQAFNKAYVEIIKSKNKTLMLNKKTRSYDVVVPLATVIKSMRKFIEVVEKDLKIGKFKKVPKTQAKANNKQEKRK